MAAGSARALDLDQIPQGLRQKKCKRNLFSLAGCDPREATCEGGLPLMTSAVIRLRLANFPLVRDEEAGGRGEFELPHERRLLSSWLGMTPENLSRAFAALKPYGIAMKGPRVRLADPDDLRRLAKPSILIDEPAA
jgi:Crp-like helix-turn-helix domain